MISDLYIQATQRSPEISMSATGTIRISGRLIPYEPDEFFAPLMDWASGYCKEPAEETVIEASIEYTNCTNHGKLYWFLMKLKEVTLSGKKMTINYTYEADDDDMRDLGLYWSELFKVPVNMIQVEKLKLPEMKKAPYPGENIQYAE
jgi:hypothetical protein